MDTKRQQFKIWMMMTKAGYCKPNSAVAHLIYIDIECMESESRNKGMRKRAKHGQTSIGLSNIN